MSATAQGTAGADRTTLAIVLMVAAMSVVPVMDAIAKLLSRDLPVEQVSWARFAFNLLFVLPLVLHRHGTRALRPRRPGAQLLRGLLTTATTLLFFGALAVAPLADAIALVFIAPLVVTAASPFVLGEQVGLHRWCAVVVGFLGALIVIRPGFGSLDTAMLMAAGAGICHACFLLVTRKLAGADPPLATLALTALTGTAVLGLVQPFVWVAPRPEHWLLFAAMGFCSALGHFLLIKAFELGPATLLAPFGYSEIAMATLLGLLLFGDFPDAVTWCGILVIVASGLYITVRERRRGRPASTRLRA